MKVLYVSDLDGTLLNMKQELNKNTAEQINKLINKGVNFTISTGRGDSVRTILKDINFKLPAMILNGALNYDFDKKEYIDAKAIPVDKVIEIMQIVNDFGFITFEIQTIFDGKVSRLKVNDWNHKSQCLALNITNNKAKMEEFTKLLNKVEGITFFTHKKVYADDIWFCDIILKDVSKASALKEFKEKYGFDKVIAFGDSENDLPLAEVSDEFYAVSNGVEVVKQKATGVIGSCFENGVAEFISKQNI